MSVPNPNLQKKPPLNPQPDIRTSDGRRDILLSIIQRKDKDDLWDWIFINFGVSIPRKRICKDHDAPFDFVADYIFGDIFFAIVLANRSGGKTMNFGILDTIMSWVNPNTEVATVGAIQSQAQKCYSYFLDYSSKFPFEPHVVSRTMNKTTLDTGGSVQVLTGTMSGVNSPHPQLVFLDEIDLMVWGILQQAFSMAQSNEFTRARTVVTSTRKFANGPMQRMLNDAVKKKQKVYQWCIWEVVAKLPHDNPELMEQIQEMFGTDLPDNIGDADGYYFWEDLLTKRDTLDDDTWETEWLCLRPGLKGVVYGTSYSDDENLIMDESWTPVGKGGYIFLAEDFGFGEGHPDVVLFCWIPTTFDRIVVFDELYMTGMQTDQIWDEINERLKKYGGYLPDRLNKIRGTIRGWVGDYHGLTEIADRQAKGAPMMTKHENASLYLLENGIPIVKRLLSSGRLMIHVRCVNLRLEMISYRFKKNLDGTYSNITVKEDDHGPDALRYLCIKLYELIMRKVNDTMIGERKAREPLPTPKEVRPRVRRQDANPLKVNPDEPVTGEMSSGNSWR